MEQFNAHREKIAAVLSDIDQNYRLADEYQADGHTVKKIAGQIAANVTFDGALHTIEKFAYEPYQDTAEVNLQAKGQKLAKLNVAYNFGAELLRPSVNELLPQKQQLAAWEQITEIAVTSPAWEKSNGIMTQSGEAPQTVKVFHAPDETAHEVVDKLYDTVERSKKITKVAKKLTELSLPAAAAEGLIDLIDALAEKSKTTEQDAGREM